MNTLNFDERTLQEATANAVGGVDKNIVYLSEYRITSEKYCSVISSI